MAVSGEQDYKIYLWDVVAGRLALPPLVGSTRLGLAMRFSLGGDRLLSTDWSDTWRLWDTRSGQLLLSMPALGASLHFSPDDRLVRSGAGGKVQIYRYRRGAELRTVVRPSSNKKGRGYAEVGAPCVDADSRLAAISTEEGVALVDVARGEETGLLPLPRNYPLRFGPDGSLWTFGSAGLLQLKKPVTGDPQSGSRRYGPPQRIFGTTNGDQVGSSADMRVVAIPDFSRGTILFHRDSKRQLPLGPQEDVRYCAVSPDGRWVATATWGLHEGAGVKVWDAGTGKHVKDLPVGGHGNVLFSPDGKWLLTTSRGCRLWAVGTWEEGPSPAKSLLKSTAAFSGDGKLLAMGDAPGVVRLVITDTGAEIARLTAPEQGRLHPCCFASEGAQLIAINDETMALHVFDLRAIRAGLAELDLDWGAPPLPAGPAPPVTPLSIYAERGDVLQLPKADALVKQAGHLVRNKEPAKALAALRKAIEIAPSHALAQNNLAWLLLTGPKELRDAAQALSQARKAVELEPDQYLYRNTLGVALYRTGQFAQAVPVLEQSLAEGKGEADAFDLFFLAMCHQRLGAPAKAKDCLAAGRHWFQEHQDKMPADWVQELSAFQAEAAAVLARPPGKL